MPCYVRCVLRGAAPSVLTLALVPTLYANAVNSTLARGFRLQYIASDLGATLRPEALRGAAGGVGFELLLTPVTQQFTIQTHALVSIFELLTRLLALASGLSFLARTGLWVRMRAILCLDLPY